MSIPTNFLTATETQALLAEGTVTTRQVVHDHQVQYQERDAVVHAWVHTNFDGAFALADSGETKGLPFHGVTIGVKNIISMSNRPHSGPVLLSRLVIRRLILLQQSLDRPSYTRLRWDGWDAHGSDSCGS